jgi:hypothetical protein
MPAAIKASGHNGIRDVRHIAKLQRALPCMPGWVETENGVSSCQHSNKDTPWYALIAVTFSLSAVTAVTANASKVICGRYIANGRELKD